MPAGAKKNVAAKTEDKARLRQEYFTTGLHYHIAARFANIACLQVSGNLAHHAVEMYLKGYLCRKLDERQRRNLSHNLGKIWKLFKQEVGDSSLTKFDDTISDIDKFEDIRYPEKMVPTGMTAMTDFKRGNYVPDKTSPQKPHFGFFLDELDELSKLILEKASVNPTAYTDGLRKDARTYLTDSNNAATWWVSKAA
jgi:hypothetical protein